ncbi:hypothetical protein RR48_13612 [Papilio machaon]|uniref:Uncharacterized protein n=1 Tax=Papilio machaon TaxID=76193 RepID=A0A194RF35_PAPMA|nr:hypothetical protein RR48_13612 [Papilio machaon]
MKFSTGSSSSSLASDSLSRKSTLCIYAEVDATMPPPPCERHDLFQDPFESRRPTLFLVALIKELKFGGTYAARRSDTKISPDNQPSDRSLSPQHVGVRSISQSTDCFIVPTFNEVLS